MACMEHTCVKCNWAEFNNKPRMSSCPKCGSDIQSFFDEDPVHDDRDYDCDEEEDR